jgi:hypothetical protein
LIPNVKLPMADLERLADEAAASFYADSEKYGEVGAKNKQFPDI